MDEALWKNPGFIRVNTLMTGVWDGVFLLNFLSDRNRIHQPGFIGRIMQVLTYVVLMAGIIFTLRYPDYIMKKYTIAQSPGAG